MPSGLTSPRNPAAVLPDLGARSAFVDRQRVGRPRRRRPGRRARLRRLAGLVGAVGLGLLVVGGGGRWLPTTPRLAEDAGGGARGGAQGGRPPYGEGRTSSDSTPST